MREILNVSQRYWFQVSLILLFYSMYYTFYSILRMYIQYIIQKSSSIMMRVLKSSNSHSLPMHCSLCRLITVHFGKRSSRWILWWRHLVTHARLLMTIPVALGSTWRWSLHPLAPSWARRSLSTCWKNHESSNRPRECHSNQSCYSKELVLSLMLA